MVVLLKKKQLVASIQSGISKYFYRLCVLSFGSFLVGGAMIAPRPSYAGGKGIVELFTSQGCSSCPPADILAGKLAENSDLVVLTLPVTYWDYLGWKDTFAQKAFTERQYAYAQLRGDRSVYTPQMVVNGGHHAVGSDAKQVRHLLEQGGLPVDVALSHSGPDLLIDIAGQAYKGEATIILATFQKSGTVAIGRGENRDREVTYTNIVKKMRPIGKWSGKALTMRLAKNTFNETGMDGVAVLLQTTSHGLPAKIIGAASLLTVTQ